jgi:hypothetical protein
VPPRPGHIVVVGHDYRSAPSGVHRIAGNAVLLPTGDPVRVAAFEGGADPVSVAGIDAAIDAVALERGRRWERIAASAAAVPATLVRADVLVIYPQATGDDAALSALGLSWAAALESFLRRGGVIVLFDAPSLENRGTYQILEAAGRFSATARVEVSGAALEVTTPADAVALGVPLVYVGETHTVRFVSSEEVAVVSHPEGPVVIHSIVTR